MGHQPFQNPLTQEQLSLLQKGPNYAHYPQIPPIEDYITSHRTGDQQVTPPGSRRNLGQMLTESSKEYNSTVNIATSTPQCKSPYSTPTGPVQGGSHSVVHGVAMVIMDKQDYTTKAQALLQDTNTYKVLPKDPISYPKNKLITLLKNIKQTGGLSTQKYKQLYPTSAVPSQVLWSPQNT